MNVWLITTGSSDIQLTNKDDWDTWYREIKRSVYRLPFEPVKTGDDDQERYRLPARVLGIAYGDRFSNSIQSNLVFPLLDNFTQELNHQKIDLNQIIVLTSDQDLIFSETDRENKQCPFWQDTCGLHPILENYLNEKFPHAEIRSLVLKPKSSNLGLDNWDYVLELVQREINELVFEPELHKIYVSHQAGTPAISSAVQFCSLARFGDRVRFLVSSEQGNQESNIISSSAYLKGIRKQEAIRLLIRYDYSGVEALLADYFKNDSRISTLIKAAIQWNNAQFDHFLETLSNHPNFFEDVETKKNSWWWIAYEEAYLAVIREKQENIVEAFFHSFRAFEYIFLAWSNHEFGRGKDHIEENKGKLYLKKSVLSDDKNYFAKAKFKQSGDPKDDLAKLKRRIEEEEKILLDLSTIHKLFRSCRSEYQNECREIEIFWDQKNNKENNVSEKRNIVIHQVRGMSSNDLKSFWTAREESDAFQEKSWEDKLLIFLNFIIREDSSEEFSVLEEASLMPRVHQELTEVILAL